MAKAQAKYEKWLEKMENDDGTATDTYCIIREIHWDEEHGYVMKHDRLVWSEQACSRVEYRVISFGKTKEKADSLWERFGCDQIYVEPITYHHKGTYKQLKKLIVKAKPDEYMIQNFH